MIRYDYEIIYKKSKQSVVVDALSKQFEKDKSLFSLPWPILGWLNDSH